MGKRKHNSLGPFEVRLWVEVCGRKSKPGGCNTRQIREEQRMQMLIAVRTCDEHSMKKTERGNAAHKTLQDMINLTT